MKQAKITYAQKIALLLFGTFMAFSIGEAVSRITYTKPWYEKLIEKQNPSYWKKGLSRNSLGVRDRDYPAIKPPNSTRVLVLGDSFTFGAGVRDSSLIFPERLERQLNLEFAEQGKQVEILNGALGGSHTHQWLKLLARSKDSFTPDLILIVFFLRDGTNITVRKSFFNPIRQEIQSREEQSFLYRHLYLFRVIQDYMDRLSISKQYSAALNMAYFGSSEETDEWTRAQENLLEIKRIGEERNAKVALVVFPILVELNDNYPFKEVSNLIEQFSIQNDMPTHNLLPAFMGMHGPDLWVSSFDQHPNARGHKIAADSILPFLKSIISDEGTD